MTIHLQELQAEDSILQQISSADSESNNDQMHKYMTAELEKYHERVSGLNFSEHCPQNILELFKQCDYSKRILLEANVHTAKAFLQGQIC